MAQVLKLKEELVTVPNVLALEIPEDSTFPVWTVKILR